MRNARSNRLRVLWAFALVIVGLIGCSSKNALGRRTLTLMPDALLNSQSATLYSQQKEEAKISTNAPQVALVNEWASV